MIQGRSSVKTVIFRCVTRKRLKEKVGQQLNYPRETIREEHFLFVSNKGNKKKHLKKITNFFHLSRKSCHSY